ncbi:MAG: hypothetical protein IT299_00390 [Dehalococcoidia bacterium]|nr:hypothetical protein [Dehalococcoidia bacterium]
MRTHLWTSLACAALLAAACGGDAAPPSTGGTGTGATGASTGSTASEATAQAKTAPTTAGATAAKEPPVQLEACKLLTKAEVVAAHGPTGDPKESTPVAGLFGCDFPNLDVPIVHDVEIRVMVYDNAPTAASEMQKTIQSNKYEAITGLGEGAYTTWPLPGVVARRGRFEVAIDVSPPDGGTKAQNVEVTRGLMELALKRLP